ncbi:DNA gyrase inhibitor YacG [Ruegeria arenilitoris]|uniref:DNA gyrase inhibitor YacG n=1 Tax=Ruegeria arenilitoris TaxID=1173585 RepID=A0A238K3I3_9RHOB|nr:DNA gyrase inhibitor YacG [Ruegeria arenilitoris]SMX36506.1 DNA gyrase inhibitor YacG [Ruegeria arenilitoris]
MSCPICGEDSVKQFRPFCSKRCADIDLAKWLNGSYSVPSQREDDLDDEIQDDVEVKDRPH